MRWSLFGEIVTMSWDTLRGNKLRSALTVLGVVIGITSIVGMTSLIRGFDESFRDLDQDASARTRSSSRSSRPSACRRAPSFQELLKRPNMTPDDADGDRARRAVDRGRRRHPRQRRPGAAASASTTGNQKTKPLTDLRHDREVPARDAHAGRDRPLLHDGGGPAPPATSSCSARRRTRRCSRRRIRSARSCASASTSTRSSACMAKRPSPGGFDIGADDFVDHSADDLPEAVRHPRAVNFGRGEMRADA